MAGADLVGHLPREVFVSFHRRFVVCGSEAALSYARMQMESRATGGELLREIFARLLLFVRAGCADHRSQRRTGPLNRHARSVPGLLRECPGHHP